MHLGPEIRKTISGQDARVIRKALAFKFVTNVAEDVKVNPGKSMRKIANEIGTSRYAIWLIVKEAFNYKSHAAKKRHLLTIHH